MLELWFGKVPFRLPRGVARKLLAISVFLLEGRTPFLAISNVLPTLAFAGRIPPRQIGLLDSHSGILDET